MNKKADSVPDQAARIEAVAEMCRLAEKLAAGVVERDAICELLSPTPKTEGIESHHVLQEWHTEVYRDPAQKPLASDLKEVLQKLGMFVRQTLSCANDPIWKRPTSEEMEKLGRRLGLLAERIGASLSTTGGPAPKTAADKRNAWIYAECCKGTPYFEIRRRLKKKPKSWERIESDQGIKKAAERYAERFGLPMPANRKPGRPQKRKTKH